MAHFTDGLTEEHVAFTAKQNVFFVATAAAYARINLSPKGDGLPVRVQTLLPEWD